MKKSRLYQMELDKRSALVNERRTENAGDAASATIRSYVVAARPRW
jgi:protein subunit release factor B